MDKNHKVLAVVIVVLAITMTVISYWAFKTGYFAAKEIWTSGRIISRG